MFFNTILTLLDFSFHQEKQASLNKLHWQTVFWYLFSEVLKQDATGSFGRIVKPIGPISK